MNGVPGRARGSLVVEHHRAAVTSMVSGHLPDPTLPLCDVSRCLEIQSSRPLDVRGSYLGAVNLQRAVLFMHALHLLLVVLHRWSLPVRVAMRLGVGAFRRNGTRGGHAGIRSGRLMACATLARLKVRVDNCTLRFTDERRHE